MDCVTASQQYDGLKKERRIWSIRGAVSMQQRRMNKSLQQREPEGRDLHESGRSEGRAAYQELGGEEADPTIGLGTETALPTSGG